MQGGWGAVGGAWGGPPPAVDPIDDDSEQSSAPVASPAKPAFGSSYKTSPLPSPTLPVSTSSDFGGPSPSNREAQLQKREANLAERERKLRERQRELESAGVLEPKKNWPILFPFWRHSISEDIPERSRRVVREAYSCWWGLVFCLSFQVFCASVMLGYDVTNRIPSWFLSLIFWILGVPLSLWLWYKRIYNAAKTETNTGFIIFFMMFFLHWAYCVYCAIGLPVQAATWCFSGFLAGFDAFSDASNFAGVIYMIGGGLWSALALYSMWVLKDAWFFFRGQGGKAQVQKKEKQDQALAAFRLAQGTPNSSNQV